MQGMMFSTLRPDDLDSPPRPIVEAVELGTHKKKNGAASSMYKLFLVQNHPAPRRSSYIIDVVQLEIFGCVQRVNHPEITRWKQIAQVDLRKKKGCMNQRCNDGSVRSSIKIAGFSSGFRYQIAIRGMDARGKRSLFSEPVYIVPKCSDADVSIH
ncbi:hypothetical protein Ocin01_05872 [Orchesella cincta]|uniref:Uncharacterized protein n=1 Tax=Orchesella cincta TaxID=48709 RepID=A0A1D2N6H0_ORCCI|nr:hypothetical protein Ocin01_05872 [Orchesella cincta]